MYNVYVISLSSCEYNVSDALAFPRKIMIYIWYVEIVYLSVNQSVILCYRAFVSFIQPKHLLSKQNFMYIFKFCFQSMHIDFSMKIEMSAKPMIILNSFYFSNFR